ncbi:TIGR03747 family integrating conjugative element membrane protein [Pseudomonas koreensis]|uniref:TIGR03747 family integrating conjugative element membrane protein n=1 Tax=Pseudomonas koreensis TaxID=198620 RepID=A0A9X2XEQ6_9PSED|nr:TIGR03747 family integrating conjugative element membrane protein [Pseudomonas koreensis]MCU7247286.1 TIGR03747 family integrating conjugative element membrane protein [Pseudomonas koreensis]
MSDPATTAQRQQQREQNLFVAILTLPLRFVAVLMGSLLLSIVIECAGMYVFWPEEGWGHSQRMYEFELSQLTSNFKRSALVQEPGRTAHSWVQVVYEALVVKTGVNVSMQSLSMSARAVYSSENHDMRYYVGALFTHLESNIIAALYTVLVFTIRLVVLVLSAPLFIVAAFIGVVDGLVCRDIRRFGAGRESGYIYHRAKAFILPLATLPWVIYLAIPISIDPGLIIVPSAILLGLAIAITARSFKKYL